MTSEFDDGYLHAQAYSKVRGLVLTSPLCGLDHALCSSVAESSWDEDTVGSADLVPGFVEVGWVVELGLSLEVRGVDPDEVELLTTAHSTVLEGLDDTKV